MENFSYHVPFYVVTGGIDTAGHSSELAPGQVGLFDRATFSVATGSGNGKEFFFAQGAMGGKDWYLQTPTESHKSPFFMGKDVENIYLSNPTKLQNEEWIIGFDGSESSKSLKFEKGKAVRLKLYFHGQPTYRFFGGPKEYVISHTPQEDCSTPCTEPDCPDTAVDALTETMKLIDKINTHVELQKFGVKAKLVSSDYSAATPNMSKFRLSLVDNGDLTALQAVQAQAPVGVNVTRVARNGSTSVYEFCQLSTASAPSAFAQSGSVLQAVCGECPSGSTLVAAKDVYIVKRNLTSTGSLGETLADAVGTAYGVGASDATYLGQDSGYAIIEVKVAAGAAVTPIATDIVEFARTEAAVCTFAAPSSVAWVSAGSGISSQRTLKIGSLQRPDCDSDGDRIADLRAILSGVPGIVKNGQGQVVVTKIEGTACSDDYTVTQMSNDCFDEGCLTSNVTFTYADLPAFEGRSWEVVPATITPNPARKTGIRISAGYMDPKNGNCTFDITSYFELEPVKMELSLLEEQAGNCDYASLPSVTQTKFGRIANQTGEQVIREVIMKDASYLNHVHVYDNNPLMREKFNSTVVERIDRNAFYKLYYVTFKASYGASYRKNEQEKFTAVFAFKEDSPAAAQFESQILSVLTAKSGVALHIAN